MLQVIIARGNVLYAPAVLDGAVWETELDGAPGKFSFAIANTLNGEQITVENGDAVRVCLDGADIFLGYVFTCRKTHLNITEITAYDQTRYLKNRDTYVYDGITAGSLLRRIADDHGLKTGVIADTGVSLEPCAEDNKTLADIIRGALSRTEETSGCRFVLFDNCGALSLRRASDMQLDLMVDASAGQTFCRTVSIDRDSFNCVKLVCDQKSGLRAVYTAADNQNTARWGKLQYYGKIAEDYNGTEKAAALLKLYNTERRELEIGGAAGDARVRAGCSLWAAGAITGDADAALYTVSRARHVWRGGGYFMDLILSTPALDRT